MFAESNVELKFDEEYYDEVVEKAIKSGTGTRALNSIVKSSLSSAAFDLLGLQHNNTRKVTISKHCVSDPKLYTLE